jgi:hypothetical protein
VRAIRERFFAPTVGPERDLAMDSGTPGPAKNRRLVELEAEARHARERYRSTGQRPTVRG